MRCPKLPELKATKNATGWYFFIVCCILILVENYVVLKMQFREISNEKRHSSSLYQNLKKKNNNFEGFPDFWNIKKKLFHRSTLHD